MNRRGQGLRPQNCLCPNCGYNVGPTLADAFDKCPECGEWTSYLKCIIPEAPDERVRRLLRTIRYRCFRPWLQGPPAYWGRRRRRPRRARGAVLRFIEKPSFTPVTVELLLFPLLIPFMRLFVSWGDRSVQHGIADILLYFVLPCAPAVLGAAVYATHGYVLEVDPAKGRARVGWRVAGRGQLREVSIDAIEVRMHPTTRWGSRRSEGIFQIHGWMVTAGVPLARPFTLALHPREELLSQYVNQLPEALSSRYRGQGAPVHLRGWGY